jgi:hypothetical protein
MTPNTYFIGVIISNFEGSLTIKNLAKALEMSPGELITTMEKEPELNRKFNERAAKLTETNRRALKLMGDGEFMRPRRGFGDRCDKLLMRRQVMRRERAEVKR